MAMFNLLRKSNINPNISAYSQLHGTYDFNHIPIVPLGMRVMVREKPDDRDTRAHHAVEGGEGGSIGPFIHHCRCYKVWIKATKVE